MKKIVNYLGNKITFNSGDSIAVNATQMAKPFNKQVSDFLRLTTTDRFLASLESVRGIPRTALIQTVQGGISVNQGTWFHEDVAIEFARWLSPEFAIWCNDRIKELTTKGYTKLDNISRSQLAQMILEAEAELDQANKTIALQAPKVEFAEEVFEAPELFSVGAVAKMLGTGQNRLFAKLRARRVLKPNNEPYQTFVERGYFKTKGTKVGNARYPMVVSQTMVTTRGIAWIRLNIV